MFFYDYACAILILVCSECSTSPFDDCLWTGIAIMLLSFSLIKQRVEPPMSFWSQSVWNVLTNPLAMLWKASRVAVILVDISDAMLYNDGLHVASSTKRIIYPFPPSAMSSQKTISRVLSWNFYSVLAADYCREAQVWWWRNQESEEVYHQR